jgi:hypothetical protein
MMMMMMMLAVGCIESKNGALQICHRFLVFHIKVRKPKAVALAKNKVRQTCYSHLFAVKISFVDAAVLELHSIPARVLYAKLVKLIKKLMEAAVCLYDNHFRRREGELQCFLE